MTTYEADLEQTTALALEEKSKLIKSLRHFDMVFFTVCAFVGLDTLGTVASNGPQGFFWLVAARADLRASVRAADGRGRLELHRGGRAVRVDEARLGPLRRRHRRDPLLGHEPALGRRLARVHRDRGLGRERVRASGSGTWGDYLFKLALHLVLDRRRDRVAALRQVDPEPRRVPALRHARPLLDHRRRLRRSSTASTASRRTTRRRRRPCSSGSCPCCSSTTSASSCRTAPPRRWRTRAATCRSPSSRPACSAC